MKIYIDWDKMKWYTNKEQLFEDLIERGEFNSYSDFLANEYAGRLDQLLYLPEDEKIKLYEKYEKYVKSNFEYKVEHNDLNYTVLNIEANNDITIKELP